MGTTMLTLVDRRTNAETRRVGVRPLDRDEVALIRACQQGSEEAFRELVERYQRRTYWIAYNMLGNYDLASDIGQEAFLRVYKAIHRFDLKRSFYTWLYQIVVNLCIDHMRKESGQRAARLDDVAEPPDPDAPGAGDRIESSEVRAQVHAVLERLQPNYRTVLVLRDLQGMTCEEIAEVVGANNATVRWRLHMARKMFKDAWEGVHGKKEEE
ncbi:MAG: sigma-70 family RNA polymerase sigma factor [Planctomycetes bacterium]|nr:sigma-70 family RNA polymerase sigma factor [Planctomycetota bacterium]